MQTYYTPAHHQLDLAQEGSYTPPSAAGADFALPYRTPLPDALDLDCQSGYAAPAAAACHVEIQGSSSAPPATPDPVALAISAAGPLAVPQLQISQAAPALTLSLTATGPASTPYISLAVIEPVVGMGINAAGPAATAQLQISPVAPTFGLGITVSGLDSQTHIRIDAEPPVYPISVSATGPAAIARIQVEWGQRIPGASLTTEGGGFGTRLGWIDAPDKPRELAGSFQAAEQVDSTTGSGWDAAYDRDRATLSGHNQLQQRDDARRAPWGAFAPADQDARQGYTQPPALDQQQAQPWDAFARTPAAEPQHPYIYPPAKDRGQHQPWFSTELFQPRTPWEPAPIIQPEFPPLADGTYTPPAAANADLDCPSGYAMPEPTYYDEWTSRGKWRRWYYPPEFNMDGSVTWDEVQPYTPPWPPKPIEANRPSDSSLTAGHDQMQHHDQGNRQPWGAGSWTRPYPDYGPGISWPNEQEPPAPRPPQPIIQEVYIYMPNITLYRLPDGAEFEATSVTLSSDRDSWGWTLNANLKRDADLAIIKPTSNGPVEIGCEINGHAFTFLVESYSRNRQIGNSSYTINGRSRTAWLTEPYAPKRSKALTAGYSAAALAEQELANTGFTLAWNATDWLIPAGAYSYENLTPIGAIKRLAEAAGYMLQSHPELQQLIVSPRYRVDPHKWTDPATALDAILPADLITQEGGSFTTRPSYNRAIVTGGPEGGVIVTVTRDGTAGDILAPMTTDDLITHSDAGYQRGRSLIAEGGTWEEMSITTMLTPDNAPGLILPGHLVEIQDTADTYPVIIDGTSITAQKGEKEIKVRQQLTAERRMS